MLRVTNTLKRRLTAALLSGGIMCSFGGLFLDPGCYASDGKSALFDSGWSSGGLDSLGYAGPTYDSGGSYGDSGYYGGGGDKLELLRHRRTRRQRRRDVLFPRRRHELHQRSVNTGFQ